MLLYNLEMKNSCLVQDVECILISHIFFPHALASLGRTVSFILSIYFKQKNVIYKHQASLVAQW